MKTLKEFTYMVSFGQMNLLKQLKEYGNMVIFGLAIMLMKKLLTILLNILIKSMKFIRVIYQKYYAQQVSEGDFWKDLIVKETFTKKMILLNIIKHLTVQK